MWHCISHLNPILNQRLQQERQSWAESATNFTYELNNKFIHRHCWSSVMAFSAVVGKHPDLLVGPPTSTVFPTNDRNFERSQFFEKNIDQSPDICSKSSNDRNFSRKKKKRFKSRPCIFKTP